ncbi:MAG: hypothetical protein V4850_35535 [Myxococcota bacterium]
MIETRSVVYRTRLSVYRALSSRQVTTAPSAVVQAASSQEVEPREGDVHVTGVHVIQASATSSAASPASTPAPFPAAPSSDNRRYNDGMPFGTRGGDASLSPRAAASRR